MEQPPVLPDETPFWRDMPDHVRVALTESDEEYFGDTVRTGARLLRACHAAGLPWPRLTQFDECCMYLVWDLHEPNSDGITSTEITIFEEQLWIDELYAVQETVSPSLAHVATYLNQVLGQ